MRAPSPTCSRRQASDHTRCSTRPLKPFFTDSRKSRLCSGWLRSTGWPRSASPAASSPASRSRKRSSAVKDLPGKGLLLTLDYLGESVSSAAAASAAAADYVQIIDAIVALRHRAQYLPQVDAARALTSIGPRRSTTCGESSSRRMRTGFSCASTWRTRRTPSATLDILDTLWRQGHRNVGTVIQSYLKRSADDIRRLNALGSRVRLVKGAYKEPKNVAYQHQERGRRRLHRADAAAARPTAPIRRLRRTTRT